VARAFDLAGMTNTVGASFFRFFCEEPALSLSKGRESEMPALSGRVARPCVLCKGPNANTMNFLSFS